MNISIYRPIITSCANANRYSKDKMPLFQVHPKIKVTLDDVNEAFVATRNLQENDRIEYFESHNINYNNANKYYRFVNELYSKRYSETGQMEL